MNMQLAIDPFRTALQERDDIEGAAITLANRAEILCQLADQMHANLLALEKRGGGDLMSATGFNSLNFQVYEVAAAANALRDMT